ncbi:hypothetical protein KFE98_21080 [bacterium SCSIO 12741]|nr:hypothetical protein KFE98_21080 [bacterium SCSIO 12741]
MELLDLLDAYSKAQKLSANHIAIMGAFMMLLAVLTHFVFKASDLNQGFKIGAIVCGLLFLAMGLSYRSYVGKQQQSTISIYETNRGEALETEKVRMAKTMAEFPMYLYIFSGMLVAGLLVVLWDKSNFWSGVSLSVVITFSLIIFLEKVSSHPSMEVYQEGIEHISKFNP